MLKGLGGLGDMAKMMKAAQEMQGKMAALQDELHRITVEGQSGAGLVRVTATAKGEVTALSIDPSLLTPGEAGMAEDMILAALRDAQAKAAERSKAEIRKITDAMGLPPDMKLPV